MTQDNVGEKKLAPGWYVFQEGMIKGPISAGEAFSAPSSKVPRGEKFVSRVGFQKWYPVDQVRPFLQDVQGIGTGESAQEIEHLLSENMNKLQKLGDAIPAADRQVKPTQLGRNTSLPGEQEATLVQEFSQHPLSPVSPGVVASATAPESDEIRGQSEVLEEAPKPAPSARGFDQVIGEKSYLTLKGRLRLGTLLSPWQAGLVQAILTLGLNWLWWFRRVFVEVIYHTYNTYQHHMLKNWWFCWVPGLHLVAARRLANAVREIERQNGYQSTSPTLAMFLSVFPPFYIFYVQRKVSFHWRLHVQHMQRTAPLPAAKENPPRDLAKAS